MRPRRNSEIRSGPRREPAKALARGMAPPNDEGARRGRGRKREPAWFVSFRLFAILDLQLAWQRGQFHAGLSTWDDCSSDTSASVSHARRSPASPISDKRPHESATKALDVGCGNLRNRITKKLLRSESFETAVSSGHL